MMDAAARRLPAICALSAAGGFLLWQVLAFVRAGVFEYPLDDVYIHLAMAEGIMGGTYGINPGEPASAASSILYPLLLLPFPGTAVQRMLPLVWNFAALLALAGLFGGLIARSGVSRGWALYLAMIAPFALNMPGVAALGMEHSLHALATLVLILGLWRFLRTGEIGAALVLGAVVGPMFRFEGMAISLLAAALVFLGGRRRAGFLIALGVVIPQVLFAAFLLVQGLDPVPSSVLAKFGGRRGGFNPATRFMANGLEWGGATVMAAFLLTGLVQVLPWVRANDRLSAIMATVWIAVATHLFLGTVGWLGRYEHYLMVMLGAVLVLALPHVGRAGRGVVMAAAICAAAYYSYIAGASYTWNPRAIHLQQAQMARLVDELPEEAVAVHDIGWVAWGRDARVLDLWGLASAEARRARMSAKDGQPEPEWAASLIRAHGIRYAMIYDDWIDDGIGQDWIRVAEVEMTNPRGKIGGYRVSVYATDPGFAPDLRAAIERFRAGMPEGVLVRNVGG